jgi:hypothetical protein
MVGKLTSNLGQVSHRTRLPASHVSYGRVNIGLVKQIAQVVKAQVEIHIPVTAAYNPTTNASQFTPATDQEQSW